MEFIHLNNVKVDSAFCLDKLQHDLPEWEKDIYRFLAEWFSDSSHVAVTTSGSTGQPKQLKVEKEIMRNSAKMTGEYFNFKPHQKALLSLPAKYIGGKMMLVRAIEWQLDLKAIAPHIKLDIPDENFFFGAMTPQQVEANLSGIEKIDNVIVGGAPIPQQLFAELFNHPSAFYSTFGMTETVSHIALQKIENPLPPYQCIPGATISTDERDCLVIHAPHLKINSLVTNDIIECKSKREFYWKGRFDHVINSGGRKISPETIEQKLSSLLSKPFFIAGTPNEKWGEQVTLVIEEIPFDSEKWMRELNQNLEKEHQLKSILFVPEMVKSANGKLLRKQSLAQATSYSMER